MVSLPSGIALRAQETWAPDDAPWWALHVDDVDDARHLSSVRLDDVDDEVQVETRERLTRRMYAGTHAKTVVARSLRAGARRWMSPLEGTIGNHTGWVRALTAVDKLDRTIDKSSKKTTVCESDEKVSERMTRGSRWRFSAACNYVRVWDDVYDDGEAYALDVSSTNIFTGDILALAAGSWRCEDGKKEEKKDEEEEGEGLMGKQSAKEDEEAGVDGSIRRQHIRRLFCGVADGTVRGWDLRHISGGQPPALTPLDAAPAHAGRVSALLLCPPWLVSGCHGGTLRCHSALDLSPPPPPPSPSPSPSLSMGKQSGQRAAAGRVEDAHAGKVQALCLGPGGLVYSGGDDGWVRAWSLDPEKGTLASAGRFNILGGDDYGQTVRGGGDDSPGVRALCGLRRGGGGGCVGLVAGDSGGGLTMWTTEA